MRGRSNPRPAIIIAAMYTLLAAAAGQMAWHGFATGSVPWAVGGLLGLIVVTATLPVAGLLAAVLGRLPQESSITRLLAQIQEHSMLSDNAKRVLFRDREVQMLRHAIEDDIARGDYNAAVALCEEMANVFGYRQEAEAFRSRIAEARQQQDELEVRAALDQLDAALADRDWAAVHHQAARIRRLYPDSHLVGDLDLRIQHVRQEHKHELETRFLEAADQDEPAAAMALLKQLDRYLTREEAERLTGVAQGVIVRHRDDLGARFRRAVGERRWAEAAGLGDVIITEFPNSQMAVEARSMVEVLRSRAGQGAVAAHKAE